MEPWPDAYPLSADAGRFRVLHDAGESLLDELERRYSVERRETKEPLGRKLSAPIVRIVRLVPRSPAAGPLAVVFTESPGIVLRLGRWYEDRLPSCECDDCDEDPAELIDDLRGYSQAHVEGGLWERVRRGMTGSCRETRLVGPGFRRSASVPLEPGAARAARRQGFAAPVQWAPWARRGRF